MTEGTVNLIHLYKDGDQWCAIYPMFSNLMDCTAVAFSPINIRYSEVIKRERDYGKYAVLKKLRDENPNIHASFYSDYWD